MNGSYTFFCLKEEFYNLFEFTKSQGTDEELEEQLKKMGLIPISDEKSVGFGQKVGYISDEKSALNTPSNNTPKNSSSSKETTAASNDFIKELKELFSKSSVTNINPNTLKNIAKFSNRNLKEVEAAISFMILKKKDITPGLLVAILRDGDYKKVRNILPKEIKRKDKIKFMSIKLGKSKVEELEKKILKEIGFKCHSVDNELGNILCKKFNHYIAQGGIYKQF
ncbi:hypothetical protein NRK67_01640 [Fusobacteria bacterium ZRK30]|nr:hypothetical protein NRK67_01640 [Fusobacteria bacterium ZRK30]